MKTKILREFLMGKHIVKLKDIYEVLSADDTKKRHVVRGLMGSLKNRGEVESLGGGDWLVLK